MTKASVLFLGAIFLITLQSCSLAAPIKEVGVTLPNTSLHKELREVEVASLPPPPGLSVPREQFHDDVPIPKIPSPQTSEISSQNHDYESAQDGNKKEAEFAESKDKSDQRDGVFQSNETGNDTEIRATMESQAKVQEHEAEKETSELIHELKNVTDQLTKDAKEIEPIIEEPFGKQPFFDEPFIVEAPPEVIEQPAAAQAPVIIEETAAGQGPVIVEEGATGPNGFDVLPEGMAEQPSLEAQDDNASADLQGKAAQDPPPPSNMRVQILAVELKDGTEKNDPESAIENADRVYLLEE
ncbi:hypothetical protein H4219_002188 [Mycoemilia scoparia]|uniref:Uncharacterized protein n=1 Tax=Mycoemilia scoparia TaxID=417184 RepID=A0A9W8DUF0_9FUNG|nr:hypothetical protein H4219_002188 [Mycoemilia scoparia]